jgi:hypothetical protein
VDFVIQYLPVSITHHASAPPLHIARHWHTPEPEFLWPVYKGEDEVHACSQHAMEVAKPLNDHDLRNL